MCTTSRAHVTRAPRRAGIAAAILGAGLVAGACPEKKAPSVPPPPEVLVTEVVRRDVPVPMELVGQTKGSQDVEIRARVEGFLEAVSFAEGTLVRKGQVLYRIDRKPLEASLANAQAELATRRPGYEKTQNDVKRLRPLAAKQAVSAAGTRQRRRRRGRRPRAGGGAQGRSRAGVARSRLHDRRLADRRPRRHDAREGRQPRRPRREHAAHDGVARWTRSSSAPGSARPSTCGIARRAEEIRAERERREDPDRARAGRRHGASAKRGTSTQSSARWTRRPAR